MTHEEFGQAYERDFHQTVRHLMAKGVERAYAQELAQDAWSRGWERISQLRDEHFVSEWVKTIARRLLLTSFRQNRPVDLAQMNYEPEAGPSVNLAAIEVRRAVGKCKATHRRLLEAFYWGGYSTHELATKTGKSLGAIHAELSRARQAVRDYMQVARRQVLLGEGVSRMKVQREDGARLSNASGELVSVEREAIKRAS